MPACDRTGDNCRCTYQGCSRRGNCCQCVAYHRDRNEAPACFFSNAGERTYNRSLQHLLQDRGIKP